CWSATGTSLQAKCASSRPKVRSFLVPTQVGEKLVVVQEVLDVDAFVRWGQVRFPLLSDRKSFEPHPNRKTC
ncbi:MAG: hypothetical protein O2931_08090, partial [Planctomycetota bacterium]|nr:hypothetical protein [Planctomycetota bacterium]